MVYFNPHTRKMHCRMNVFFTKYFYLLKLLYNKYFVRKKIIVISPCISMSWGHVMHNNWGDDINIFFLKQITNCYIHPYKCLVNPTQIYFRGLSSYEIVCAIGSILHLVTSNSIVWGAGMMTAEMLPRVTPKKILAVRGPLTRKMLISNGFNCPEVYGDPALLLPYYYVPKKQYKRYKIGIIPHYVDYDKASLQNFKNDKDVIFINMFDYSSWTKVIEQICSCEYIVSSSLHGIIVSEAYKIPNLWIEIEEPITGDISKRFKFHDFFLSIGKDREKPFYIGQSVSKEELLAQKKYYEKSPGLDLLPLVASCPFEIKNSIKINMLKNSSLNTSL